VILINWYMCVYWYTYTCTTGTEGKRMIHDTDLLPVASCQLPVASCQLPVASCQLPEFDVTIVVMLFVPLGYVHVHSVQCVQCYPGENYNFINVPV
jgi:hypothetical protein